TRSASSLSSAASTVFWCVSGTLRIQPRKSWRDGPQPSAWRAARASRKVSFSVSMMSGAGIESAIGSLPVSEAGGGQFGLECRTGQKRQERPRRFGLGGLGGDAARVDGHLLQLAGQRADQRDTLDGQDLADLVHADLGLALGDHLGGEAGRNQ